MAESAGERKRKATLARAETVRDGLLNAEWMLPKLRREVEEVVVALGGRRPVDPQPEPAPEPEPEPKKPKPKRKRSKAAKGEPSA